MEKPSTNMLLGVLADAQAERNPRTDSVRGRVAGGGKPTSRPLIASGRPPRRYQLLNPEQASEEVRAQYCEQPVLTLGAIGTYTVDTRPGSLGKELLLKDLDPECLTQEDDVIVALTAPFACACIDKETEGIYIPSTCAVIRMDAETRKVLDPWYLAGYLSRSSVKTKLEGKATKGAWKTLRVENLRDFDVHLPSIDVQMALGEMVRSEVAKLRDERKDSQSRNAIIDKAYFRVMELCEQGVVAYGTEED